MRTNFVDTYFTPWCRLGPYVVGIVAGHWLFRFKAERRPALGRRTVAALWMLSAALALAVVYGLTYYYAEETVPTKTVYILYLTFTR